MQCKQLSKNYHLEKFKDSVSQSRRPSTGLKIESADLKIKTGIDEATQTSAKKKIGSPLQKATNQLLTVPKKSFCSTIWLSPMPPSYKRSSTVKLTHQLTKWKALKNKRFGRKSMNSNPYLRSPTP